MPKWGNVLQIIAAIIAISSLLLVIFRKHLWPGARRVFELIKVQNPKRSVSKKVLSWQDVAKGLDRLVADAKAFEPTVVFGINRGGAIVGGVVAKQLKLPRIRILEVDSTRQNVTEQIADSAEKVDTTLVLLVDDAFRTGSHMKAAVDFLRVKYQPQSLRTAVVLRIEQEVVSPRPVVLPQIDFRAFFSHDGRVKLPWDR